MLGHDLRARDGQIVGRLQAGGVTMATVAREFGLSRERIRQIGRRHGITGATIFSGLPPTRSQLAAVKVEQNKAERAEASRKLTGRVVALRGEGLTQRDIARQTGTYQSQVSTILISAGFRSVDKPIRNLSRITQKKPRKAKPRPPVNVGLPKHEQTRHDPEIVTRARYLWEYGKSASEIAVALTSEDRPVSRNAIIGIAHRNKFPARPSPIRRAA